MSMLLGLAVLVALLGFVLLLRPELLWNRLNREAELSGAMAAFLRLIGIGALFLSVWIAGFAQ